MNKTTRAFIILAIFAFICPSLGQADIVYIKNEDKLVGTIQSPSFSVQTSYGKIRVETELLKSISFKDGATGHWTIKTVNNDQFSGTLLNDSVQFLQDDGKKRNIHIDKIKRIWRETRGPNQRTTTTIVTMKNNDRFSGKFLDSTLEIRANFMTRAIQPQAINRIKFAEKYQDNAEILLENGDLISGILKQNRFRMAPDSFSEMTVERSSVKSIQFNAPKMIKKTLIVAQQAEADSDGDGIPDYADICMDTPTGVTVGMDGCGRRSKVVRATSDGKINGYRKTLAVQSNQNQMILFDFDRAELKPQYFSVLDQAAAMLSRSPLTLAEIQGHTDNIGTEEYNLDLSEKRARKVKAYLVQKGVEGDRLRAKGFGFTINAATNGDAAGRALNRRVEIILVPDQKSLASR